MCIDFIQDLSLTPPTLTFSIVTLYPSECPFPVDSTYHHGTPTMAIHHWRQLTCLPQLSTMPVTPQLVVHVHGLLSPSHAGIVADLSLWRLPQLLWIHMCIFFCTKISENRIKDVWDSLYWEITRAHWWHQREGENQEQVLSKLRSFRSPDWTLALMPPCLALTQRVTSLLYLPLWEHFELYLFFNQILWTYTFQRVSKELFFSFTDALPEKSLSVHFGIWNKRHSNNTQFWFLLSFPKSFFLENHSSVSISWL